MSREKAALRLAGELLADAWTAGIVQTVALALAVLAIAVLIAVLAVRRFTRRPRREARHRFRDDLPQYGGDIRTSPFAAPLLAADDAEQGHPPQDRSFGLRLRREAPSPWQEKKPLVYRDWL